MLTDSSKVKVINLEEKTAIINDYWNPKIVGEMNDDKVQLVKVKGELPWHVHENEDELFLVLKGHFIVHFRDRVVHIKEGEFVIAPKQIEHKTEAKEETVLLYIEPKTGINTGNIVTDKTATNQEKI